MFSQNLFNTTLHEVVTSKSVMTRTWAIRPSGQRGSQESGWVRYQRVRIQDRLDSKPGVSRQAESNYWEARVQDKPHSKPRNRRQAGSEAGVWDLSKAGSEARQAGSLYCCSDNFLSQFPGLSIGASQSVGFKQLPLRPCWAVLPAEPSFRVLPSASSLSFQ